MGFIFTHLVFLNAKHLQILFKREAALAHEVFKGKTLCTQIVLLRMLRIWVFIVWFLLSYNKKGLASRTSGIPPTLEFKLGHTIDKPHLLCFDVVKPKHLSLDKYKLRILINKVYCLWQKILEIFIFLRLKVSLFKDLLPPNLGSEVSRIH